MSDGLVPTVSSHPNNAYHKRDIMIILDEDRTTAVHYDKYKGLKNWFRNKILMWEKDFKFYIL